MLCLYGRYFNLRRNIGGTSREAKNVFEQFRTYNLKIQPDKCEFVRPELSYLGYVISNEGVNPDPRNIEAVVQFPVPKKEKDIKAFLGLTGYYRKLIQNYS